KNDISLAGARASMLGAEPARRGGSRGGSMVTVRPQSMMFTLFGDYIMQRGGEIWVGSLIEIAGQFGLSQQAVRSALSRMRQLVESMGITDCVEFFTANHAGASDDRELAARCWDLVGLNRRYESFLQKYEPLLRDLERRDDVAPSECFVQRFLLIHEYRKFF